LGNEYKMKDVKPPNDVCLEKAKSILMCEGMKVKIGG